MKVLVIDDNVLNLDAAKAQLSSEHEVVTAGSYDEAQALLGFKDFYTRTDSHPFDVVLVDLLMPVSLQEMADQWRFAGQEMPVGIFLVLLAAKNGAKYVGMLTDSCHHTHPGSACLDAFQEKIDGSTALSLCGARVLLSNSVDAIQSFNKNDMSKPMDYYSGGGPDCVFVKNWSVLLKELLSVE